MSPILLFIRREVSEVQGNPKGVDKYLEGPLGARIADDRQKLSYSGVPLRGHTPSMFRVNVIVKGIGGWKGGKVGGTPIYMGCWAGITSMGRVARSQKPHVRKADWHTNGCGFDRGSCVKVYVV